MSPFFVLKKGDIFLIWKKNNFTTIKSGLSNEKSYKFRWKMVTIFLKVHNCSVPSQTLWFIPLVVILCFLTPVFMGSFWFVYDIILIAILIWQLRYTYKKMKFEETTLHEQKDAENKKDTIDLEHDDSAR